MGLHMINACRKGSTLPRLVAVKFHGYPMVQTRDGAKTNEWLAFMHNCRKAYREHKASLPPKPKPPRSKGKPKCSLDRLIDRVSVDPRGHDRSPHGGQHADPRRTEGAGDKSPRGEQQLTLDAYAASRRCFANPEGAADSSASLCVPPCHSR